MPNLVIAPDQADDLVNLHPQSEAQLSLAIAAIASAIAIVRLHIGVQPLHHLPVKLDRARARRSPAVRTRR